jgi:transcriptional regulator GlxA family with amidase domain
VEQNRDIHHIAILALPGFVPFDISIPYQMFPLVSLADGRTPYKTYFCGPDTFISSQSFSITGISSLERLQQADTIIIPGIHDALSYTDEVVLEQLRKAAALGIRIASICTGACLLAAAGLLDGLSATTHWEIVKPLAERYPKITLHPDILFVDNEQILTSAGLSSGLDLCLHLIKKDYGVSTAERIANFFVMPIEREAGHAQIIKRYSPQENDNLARLQLWLSENLHRELSLEELAQQACMSTRTLNRKFKDQTGEPPMTWLIKARVRRAQSLLESSDMSVEQIAAATGFGSSTALRDNFRKNVGMSPSTWRSLYGMHSKKG